MDYSNLLNNEQLEAVTTTKGPVMVSAGAGSGKTRVLTYRVAYLITECGVMPHNILAITFTNKAANEMKERICKIADGGEMVTVCTFHSLCAKLLRSYASFLPGYESNFSIYTDQETNKIFKTIFTNYGFDKTDEKLKGQIKSHIGKIKTDGLNVDEYCEIHKFYPNIQYVKRVYEDYQKELVKNNAMDFDDLLINFYKLLKTNDLVRESIQNRYKYIHIDEFQDTNVLQYEIVKLMSEKHKNILIVGDEDQSIYSWRGANIDNIFRFQKDFENVKVIKLEQNYRSTKSVLEKANMLIKNNSNRLDKQLYTNNEQGDKVEYFSGGDETAEADYVVRNIILAHSQGVPYNEMAILMRLNALTRPFEEKLLSYNIPHKIYNGFKFYDRAEIKATLAYLMAVANPQDDNNIMRIINFPKRGIGEASIIKLMEMANVKKCSLKEVLLNAQILDFPSSLKKKIEPISNILKNIDEMAKTSNLYDLVIYINEQAGILSSFNKQDETEYERFLNVNSLFNSIKEYTENNPDKTYIDYLETVTLTSQIDEEDNKNGVIIATVHSAKGLEFNTVFVIGLEEKIFPVSRDEEDSFEEERRLMYVAITRARKKLFLTNAKSRFMYGKREYSVPSRFLKEIDLIKDKVFDYISPYGEYANKFKTASYSYSEYDDENNSSYSSDGYSYKSNSYQYSKNNQYRTASNNNYTANNKSNSVDLNNIKGLTKGIQKANLDETKVKLNAKVSHPKFGGGVIVDIKDFSKNKCVTIDFNAFGKKTLSLDYAPITFLD